MSNTKKTVAQTPEGRARETQTKFINEAVNKVENNYSKLCGEMGSVNRRNGRMRDKFDEMAKTLINYANTETGPMKTSLTQFAEHISAVQDYRQALIDRMDGKVIQPLSAYKTACKHTKTDLNATLKTRTREMKQHKTLDALRSKAPSDRQSISRAETELQRATIDVERSTKALEETIDKFETQRVNDIKKILVEFVQIEMLFHAKSLERYTMCFHDLQNLNLDEHLVLFRNTLRPSAVQQRLDVVRQASEMSIGQPEEGTDVYAVPHKKRGETSPASLLPETAVTEPGHGRWDDQDDYDDEDDDYTEDEDSEGYGEEEKFEESPQSTQHHQQRLKPW